MAEKKGKSSEKCPCEGMTLERFIRPAVLMLLARGDQYGYRIVQELATMPIAGGQKPNAAGVYRCLKLLAEEGSVVSSWELSARGPAKRQYQITPAGERCLLNWLATLRTYRQALGEMIALGERIVIERNQR